MIQRALSLQSARARMLSYLLDRLTLRPRRQPLSADGASRETLQAGPHLVDVFRWHAGAAAAAGPDLFVLKFFGVSGRAEKANLHPFDVWLHDKGQVWASNPPGYGGSTGRASLQHLVPAARATYEALRTESAGHPVVLMGSSLGGAIALRMAAHATPAGLIVRDVPHLREVISVRYQHRILRHPVRAILRHVPPEFDAVEAAAQCVAPAVIVVSDEDRIVPPQCQRRIYAAYAGPKRVIHVPEATHMQPLCEPHLTEYHAALHWLRHEISDSADQTTRNDSR